MKVCTGPCCYCDLDGGFPSGVEALAGGYGRDVCDVVCHFTDDTNYIKNGHVDVYV